MEQPTRKVTRSYPHQCPVCKGRGEIGEDQAQHEAQPKYDLGDRKIYPCHVCGGGCMIWEYVEIEEEIQEQINIPQIQIGQPVINPGILDPPGITPWQQPISPGTIGDPLDNNYRVTWAVDPRKMATWNSNKPMPPHNGKN